MGAGREYVSESHIFVPEFQHLVLLADYTQGFMSRYSLVDQNPVMGGCLIDLKRFPWLHCSLISSGSHCHAIVVAVL